MFPLVPATEKLARCGGAQAVRPVVFQRVKRCNDVLLASLAVLGH